MPTKPLIAVEFVQNFAISEERMCQSEERLVSLENAERNHWGRK